ncbi:MULTISPECIES: DNA helicase RecQ [Mucilaginibacter]|uniref:DNA helicase RecQ n=1 Tax=Mucilaginibacter rubeus TaxID=2027860 RepID=A0AAE6MLY7_9SPHI|nr:MULTISPECIES: DNA helicase RecQ [Mucilaginibacter]QEM08256.1 DNA helicase RecQ [Mucilaginibacter rubeus]QEM20704.1 DNA helicase RecQ [Mucilaginibacter gossypii]QTE47045.1 DNA helicase RecQ [Mucilaginibacter rubeus]QTE53647.1 DNA helicase RecQ [Mucilaginibacter rubeus]QTE60148.1 DNA helicase RecQ [Mucilaginibacter rubeus]
METKKSLFDNLQNFFGFDNFKGEQEAIITNILAGNDTFVIMPTGGGKSMCYQLPALMSDGTAIVISPLIALMKNQVDQLRAFGGSDSIAHFLNSSLTKSEIGKVKEDVLAGKTKLLYVAPESLTKQENIDFLRLNHVSFVAVDEAHCISEWGHDFRPEYRKIRQVISNIGENIPIIALTATATPKVQQDIQKNLQMNNATVFKSSFNRGNLFYEVRAKRNVIKEIVKFVKQNQGKSGIVYCLSRKKVEEVAEALNLNGVRALPYHAGLDPKVRAETQDKFLMEDVDVIVATIAFGMGIDKPDVRYVIHHDVPKSMEGYYQETGRAGRDGGEGVCVAFYSEKDIDKLQKFMKDKPVSEREIGTQILKEVIDYCESSVCRRKQLLHYFGENFNEAGCNNMCDNCCTHKEHFDGEEHLHRALSLIKHIGEKFDDHHILSILMGEENAQIKNYEHDQLDYYGSGKEQGKNLWNSLLRQALLNNYISKDIDQYGLLRLTKSGIGFIENPHSIRFVLNKVMEAADDDNDDDGPKQSGGALDTQLLQMLKELRKKLAKQKGLPPFVIFQDPSLEEMCTHYPINTEELKQISGVGAGKALKFGKPFTDLIQKYVEDNDIDRPIDMVIKSAANKSALKVFIIQNIDRHLNLDDIAASKGLTYEEILKEVETIVNSGTKLNLNYYIDEVIDEDKQEEVFDYFRTAEADSIDEALAELGSDDYTREEVQLMRIKFMSELGN